MGRFRALAAIFLLGVVAFGAYGQSSEGRWDWNSGQFFLTIRLPLPTDSEAVGPRRRYLAEQQAQRILPQEFVRQVETLPAVSGRPLSDLVRDRPELESSLVQLSDHLRFVSSRVDEDYAQLEMVWSVGLWTDLSPLLEDSESANDVPPRLGWYPTRAFSGLVIFAMGDLPWRGTAQAARWEPSLAFRFLNPQGEVVFDPSMVLPEYRNRWGQAAFSLGKFNEIPYQDRIGQDPLRIVARGVWGARPGDLILADSDWNRLISQEANRKLLAEGRVLVLYGPFPDYTVKPNPDSAIDLEKPAVEIIHQPSTPPAPAAAEGEGAAPAGGH